MSFFAYLAVPRSGPQLERRVFETLAVHGLNGTPAPLGAEFGVRDLYGFEAEASELVEIELGEGQDVEALLFGMPDAETRLEHYRRCAAELGRPGATPREDEQVDALYAQRPIELPVVALLRDLAERLEARPIVFVADPEFSIRFGEGQEARGLRFITEAVWRATVWTDVEEPLRLVIDE